MKELWRLIQQNQIVSDTRGGIGRFQHRRLEWQHPGGADFKTFAQLGDQLRLQGVPCGVESRIECGYTGRERKTQVQQAQSSGR